MAYKAPANDIKEQFNRFLRYVVRLAPIIVIIGAIGWFLFLRSPDGQTSTSGTNETSETDPETIASAATPDTQPETKVADNSKPAETKEEDGVKEEGKAENGKLPETGPAGTLAIVAAATAGGTLFWEWRLRRATRQHSRQL